MGKAFISRRGGGNAKRLLWENASPGSSFSKQNIGLDLTAYRFVDVESRESTNSNIRSIDRIVKGSTGRCYIELDYRNVRNAKVTNNGIEFEDGKKGANGTDVSTNNSCCMPVRIWGIR